MMHSLRASRTALFTLTLLLASHSAFAELNCAVVAKKVQAALGEGKLEHYRDWDKQTTFFFWGRLGRVFDATNPATVDELFSEVIKTPDDLTTLYFASQSGELKLDWHLAHLIEDLYHFMEQQAGRSEPLSFWQTENRHFAILEALRKDEKERYFENKPDTAAAHTRVAVDRATLSMLARALAEHRGVKFANSRFWDPVRRWLSPHHGRAVKLLNTLMEWHKSLIFIYRGDEPMYHALSFYSEKIAPAEATIIKKQIEATSGQYEEIRGGIGSLFGREVGTAHEITREEVRLWDMMERQKAAIEKGGDLFARELEVEGELDHLDSALATYFKRLHADDRTHPEIRPMGDYHDTHLRIRHKEYNRVTPIIRNKYYKTCERRPEHSNYRVTAVWTYTVSYMRTVTKTRTVSDGKGGSRTETYTEIQTTSETYSHPSTDFTVHTDYNEVLNGEIISRPSQVIPQLPPAPSRSKMGWFTTGSSNNHESVHITSRDDARVKWILEKGKDARAMEKPRREQVDAGIEVVDGLIEAYPKNIEGQDEKQKHDAVLATLDNLRLELKKSQEEILHEYHQISEGEITSQWENDIVADFKDRNQQLNFRYLHLIKRIDHLREQILRKQKPLELSYENLPNYGPQIKELDAIRSRIRKQQSIITITVILLGGTYGYFHEEVNEEIEELLEKMGLKERNLRYDHSPYRSSYPSSY